jgi:radical SAM superfamily enzyme YgiQ (UPF0313 family)
MLRPTFVFVFPNVLNGRLFEGFDYHLGTGYLGAYLEANGIATTQFLGRADAPIEQIAAAILETRALMVGFSCYDSNYHLVRLLAEEVRRQSPTIPIVLGGPSATFSDALIMSDCRAVDICCRSYAEDTALDLVRWSRGEMDLGDVDGITFRKGGEIVRNHERAVSPRPLPDSRRATDPADSQAQPSRHHNKASALDAYPDPYVSGFIPPHRVSDIGLVTSRGCTFACTFCNFSAMSGWSVATHSLQHQMRVFGFLNETLKGGKSKTLVTINDDNFSLQGKRFHELLRLMADASFENLSFWAEMRTEPLREETFDLLRRAGFHEINFGLESAVPRVLAAMKKVRSSGWERDGYKKEELFLERIAWSVEKARAADIRTTVSVIFGGPTETPDDGRSTLEYIKRIGVDSYAHNFMVVGDGTDLADTFLNFGIGNDNPADRVLPPVTRMTYDVYQLPILDHDRSWLPMTGFEMRQANLFFSGTGHVPQRTRRPRGNGRGGSGRWLEGDPCNGGTAGAVVGVMEGCLNPDIARWLARVMPMNSSIWLLYKDVSLKRSFQEMFNVAGVAIPELNTLRRIEGDAGSVSYRVNEFSVGAPSYNTRTLHLLPFASLTVQPNQIPEHTERASLVYTLEEPKDLAAMMLLSPETSSLAEWSFSPELITSRATFKDACRWCSSECPATKLERMIVSEDQSIRPCTHGDAVGHVGQSLPVIAQQVKEREEGMRLERGCSSCIANDTCAKCLFTGPVDVAEYCRIQRSRPALASLFDGLTMVRALYDSALIEPGDGPYRLTSLRTLRDETLQANGRPIPLSHCVLLSGPADKAAFVYSQRHDFLASLSTDHGDALRVLAMAPSQGRDDCHSPIPTALSIDLGAAMVTTA